MTDTAVPDTMKGGYVLRPDGGHVGSSPELKLLRAGTAGTAPSAALTPDFLVPPESERDVSDATFTLAEQPPLVAIRYRHVDGDPHVAVGWLTAETDHYYRLDGDLTLCNRETKVGVTALPGVNFISRRNIVTMFEVTADGAGQLIACWGNPEIVRKRS